MNVKSQSASHCVITWVDAHEIEKFHAMGYRVMMVKSPDRNNTPVLSASEYRVAKRFVKGLSTKAIAGDLKLAQDYINAILRALRKKLQCRTNVEMGIKLYCLWGMG